MQAIHQSIQQTIESYRHSTSEQIMSEFFEGHCDAFALALYRWFHTNHSEDRLTIQPIFSIITRETRDKDTHEVIETNSYSHAVLKVGGESYDAYGPNAIGRFCTWWSDHKSETTSFSIIDLREEAFINYGNTHKSSPLNTYLSKEVLFFLNAKSKIQKEMKNHQTPVHRINPVL